MINHVYKGRRFWGAAWVIVDGVVALDPRLDLVEHSPTGLEWGYIGSGPAQLSVALLAHWLRNRMGEEAGEAFLKNTRFSWEVALLRALVTSLPREGFDLTTEVMEEHMRTALGDVSHIAPENEARIIRDLLHEGGDYEDPPYCVEEPVFGRVLTGYRNWASHPLRRAGGERDYGFWWRLTPGSRSVTWRVSYNLATGEAYAMAQDNSDRFFLLAVEAPSLWERRGFHREWAQRPNHLEAWFPWVGQSGFLASVYQPIPVRGGQ